MFKVMGGVFYGILRSLIWLPKSIFCPHAANGAMGAIAIHLLGFLMKYAGHTRERERERERESRSIANSLFPRVERERCADAEHVIISLGRFMGFYKVK